MPKSRSRKKADYIPPPERTNKASAVSGRWVAPTMIALLVIGLTWVVLYYVASYYIDFIGEDRLHPSWQPDQTGASECAPRRVDEQHGDDEGGGCP